MTLLPRGAACGDGPDQKEWGTRLGGGENGMKQTGANSE